MVQHFLSWGKDSTISQHSRLRQEDYGTKTTDENCVTILVSDKSEVWNSSWQDMPSIGMKSQRIVFAHRRA